MTLIIDGLLIAAAAFAGTYCFVLARRVRALKDLDSGIGGAITGMTRALEDARRALEEAKAAGGAEHRDLKQLVGRAEVASAQLRVLLAATRDLPEPDAQPAPRRTPPPEIQALGASPDVEADDGAPSAHAEARPAAREAAIRLRQEASAPRRGGSGPAGTAPAENIVPKPARTVWPMAPLLRPRIGAGAAPAGEADLLAALAEFAGPGRT